MTPGVFGFVIPARMAVPLTIGKVAQCDEEVCPNLPAPTSRPRSPGASYARHRLVTRPSKHLSACLPQSSAMRLRRPLFSAPFALPRCCRGAVHSMARIPTASKVQHGEPSIHTDSPAVEGSVRSTARARGAHKVPLGALAHQRKTLIGEWLMMRQMMRQLAHHRRQMRPAGADAFGSWRDRHSLGRFFP
jgi:hypothetical protein